MEHERVQDGVHFILLAPLQRVHPHLHGLIQLIVACAQEAQQRVVVCAGRTGQLLVFMSSGCAVQLFVGG
jgi:hypothetical protein